ncbi:hypothetical protein CKM354_000700700 [Cercospora kikuchii]|uniref:Abscission/NoCut checkpoint regulator n=1 Tax=Cercospora kikuchii TaxID=84275 RepID=A0A9P3CGA3_9PEZI|nr:uncharacterized protein CKM354_000700700 [Cercospora kikuchii]GIZ43794.1 hypothetical protein CKM354_000700700 [Cercospora kikuchii]
MPGQDDDLLARLNALKPSSVKLDPGDPIIDIQPIAPQSVEDKLAERLKTLRAGGSLTPTGNVKSTNRQISPVVETIERNLHDESETEKDPIRNWQEDTHEQSVDDLLAELEADGQWKLDPEEPKNVQSLLKEAQQSLSNTAEPTSGPKDGHRDDGKMASHADDDDKSAPSKTEDEQDEEDADEYIARVLAELDIEKKSGEAECDNEPSDHNASGEGGNTLDLPSTPSQLKDVPVPSEHEPPSYEDSELEARFSKLGFDSLGLPSTPTSKPSSKPKVVASVKPKNKSNLPTYTDEDIDSWCCICNEDGEVRCLGCDGDLYCHACWSDGHGTGPGQERGHKAVQYSRKPPKAAAA